MKAHEESTQSVRAPYPPPIPHEQEQEQEMDRYWDKDREKTKTTKTKDTYKFNKAESRNHQSPTCSSSTPSFKIQTSTSSFNLISMLYFRRQASIFNWQPQVSISNINVQSSILNLQCATSSFKLQFQFLPVVTHHKQTGQTSCWGSMVWSVVVAVVVLHSSTSGKPVSSLDEKLAKSWRKIQQVSINNAESSLDKQLLQVSRSRDPSSLEEPDHISMKQDLDRWGIDANFNQISVKTTTESRWRKSLLTSLGDHLRHVSVDSPIKSPRQVHCQLSPKRPQSTFGEPSIKSKIRKKISIKRAHSRFGQRLNQISTISWKFWFLSALYRAKSIFGEGLTQVSTHWMNFRKHISKKRAKSIFPESCLKPHPKFWKLELGLGWKEPLSIIVKKSIKSRRFLKPRLDEESPNQ